MRAPKPPKRSRNAVLDKRVRDIDTLAKFDEFRAQILPALRKDLESGISEQELLEKYKKIAAARLITLTATEANLSIALAAARDILDRTTGKATERKEVTHRLANLPEKEIDAILLTELSELGETTDSSDTPATKETD